MLSLALVPVDPSFPITETLVRPARRSREAHEMALGKKESLLSEVFQLLERQKLLEHLPHSSRQIRKDEEISARIQALVDKICVEQRSDRAKIA